MKLTKDIIKKLIKEEFNVVFQEDAEATKAALAKAPDLAESIAQEVYKKCEDVSKESNGAIGAAALAGMVADFLAGMKAQEGL